MKPLSINWFQSGVALIIILLSIAANNSNAGVNYQDTYSNSSNPTTITVPLSSLFPPSHDDSCKPSPKGTRQGVSLEVRHKYGPCSPFASQKSKRPTYKEILEHDEARIESINNRVNPKRVMDLYGSTLDEKQVTLPAFGDGSYIVTVGLGTPRKDVPLTFDTGSTMTWTQCEPCEQSCFRQEAPIFNPSQSSTYSEISCKSPLCSEVQYRACSKSSTCLYRIQYGDQSFSFGNFAKETLYLGRQDVIPNYLFGCGQNNQGIYPATTSGLLGLGKGKLSLISQAASSFGNAFSYCLPFNPYSTGYLTLGATHTVSSSSLDFGVVPDGSGMGDVASTGLDKQQQMKMVGMDREARVLRYREKRKNRKFEKTIRYASRKAYAETRPRIKGRFAKRADVEADLSAAAVDGLFAADPGYGVVPTF